MRKKALIVFIIIAILSCLIGYFFISDMAGFLFWGIMAVYLLLLPFLYYIDHSLEIKIKNISENYKELEELNKKYEFGKINKKNRSLTEREYSNKSYDRARAKDILRYNIENNWDNIRSDLQTAINNKKLYDSYIEEFSNLNKELDEDYIRSNLNISKKKFENLEKKILLKNKIKENVYDIRVNVNVYYESYGGKNYRSKSKTVYFDELAEYYDLWKKGKNYEVTSKVERKIMNNDLRYNVLKRDNFQCVICGASSKDGAKLHVDHIVPVSKGSKTVMSNLQTLCDRCNLGKSNKIDDVDLCPKCGGVLIERHGKYGDFIGCSNYPKCKYTKEK